MGLVFLREMDYPFFIGDGCPLGSCGGGLGGSSVPAGDISIGGIPLSLSVGMLLPRSTRGGMEIFVIHFVVFGSLLLRGRGREGRLVGRGSEIPGGDSGGRRRGGGGCGHGCGCSCLYGYGSRGMGRFEARGESH